MTQLLDQLYKKKVHKNFEAYGLTVYEILLDIKKIPTKFT